MAYQVISQNNTTTTLADENGNIIRVPARVSLATSTDYTITKVNNTTATLEDGNGNIIRDVPCVAVLFGSGGGGGDQHNLGWYATPEALRTAHPTASDGDWAIVGSTDTVWVWDSDSTDWKETDSKAEVTPDMVIIKSATMPSASTTPAKAVYQYTGATNATFTHGYIYENVKTATYTGTVSFEAATLSGTTVACSGDNFANFLTESGVEPLSVVSGTMTFDSASELWALAGKDSDGNTVLTFQEYQQDFVDAGFTFTGTPQDGDVVAFTCTVEEASASYAWNRIDVQPSPVIPDPLPSQTGNAGKFLTTDGTDASWSDKPLVNTAAQSSSVSIATANPSSVYHSINIGPSSSVTAGGGIAIGENAKVNGAGGIAIIQGNASGTASNYTVLIGSSVSTPGQYGVLIGSFSGLAPQFGSVVLGGWSDSTNNAPTGTFWVTLRQRSGYIDDINSYQLLDFDGTIPTARLTKVNTTVTLAAADWSSNTQTVSVTGMTAIGVVTVSPDPADQSAYTSAGILCTAQAAGTLTFTCSTTPSADLSVNVVML